MSSLIPVLIIAGLILLNGLFVAAEFAVVGAPRASIEHRAAQGNRVARRVHAILTQPQLQDRYIATAQLGITLASLGLGMYGEHLLAEWIAHQLEAIGPPRWVAAHTIASVLAITILTYFHIVVGEMVPKSISLQRAERAVLWITPVMEWAQLLLYPLVLALNGLGNLVLKLLGIQRQAGGHEHYYSTEELQYIIRESQEGGMLRAEAARIIDELFEFGDLTAGEVMVPRVRIDGIPLGATSQVLADIVRRTPHTRYPVYEGDLDHIAGMIHIKDVLRVQLANRSLERGDLRPMPYVPEATTLDQVLATMRAHRTQMVVVMDEHGGTAGLITIEDLFEEVVGEIDERARGHPSIMRDEAGRLLVAGTVRLEEVGEQLGVVLEHEEVDTVSGLILTLLGRPPVVGDEVSYDQVRFVVLAVKGYGVDLCRVTPLAPAESTLTVPE
ncbi:MAG: membrane protein [Herpetosiphonaceae bacterium]|nr:MAG: membrane protein [Herpetosiphonaceae bacterium]